MYVAVAVAALGFVAVVAALVAYAALCVGGRGDPFIDGGS